MACAGSDRTDRPGSDLAPSSDEEGFVSSQSTASAEPDGLAKHHLSTALGKLHLQRTDSSCSSDEHNPIRISTPGTGASMEATTDTETRKRPMQLLGLPLDVLRYIVKEVKSFPVAPKRFDYSRALGLKLTVVICDRLRTRMTSLR